MRASPTQRLMAAALVAGGLALLAVLAAIVAPVGLVVLWLGLWSPDFAPFIGFFTLAPIPLAIGFYLAGARANRLGGWIHAAGLLGVPFGQIMVSMVVMPSPSDDGPSPGGEGFALLPGLAVLGLTLLIYAAGAASFWWSRGSARRSPPPPSAP